MAAINALNGIYTMRGCEQPLIVRFADPKRPRPGETRLSKCYIYYIMPSGFQQVFAGNNTYHQQLATWHPSSLGTKIVFCQQLASVCCHCFWLWFIWQFNSNSWKLPSQPTCRPCRIHHKL